MPELPEVEFAARRLREWAVGRRIERVEARPEAPLRDIEPSTLKAGLVGRRIQRVRRRGKQLLIDIDGGLVLLSHLGMTGKWVNRPVDAPSPDNARVQLFLDGARRLDYLDTRRLGRIRLLSRDDAARHPEIARLGPDVLEVCKTPAAFAEAVGWSNRAIKVALMDQEVVAGVGNIYAAEALWAARISPFQTASKLSEGDYNRLAVAMTEAMTESLARETDDEIRYIQDRAAPNPFKIYGRTDQPCPACGTLIIRALQQGRSTFYCPVCQPDP